MAEDKQFEPTQRRQEQARRRGQAPRSRELTAAGLLLLATGTATIWLPALCRVLLGGTEYTLAHANEALPTPQGLGALFRSWLSVFVHALGPLLLLIVMGAFLLTFLQGGLTPSFYPLQPRWEKINPAVACRRLFSAQGLIETLKSLLKVFIAGLVAWLVLKRRVTDWLLLGEMEPSAAAGLVGRFIGELCLKTALVLLLLGAADYLWQRFDYLRSLRMTREELREELKETEGDPLVRAQQRRARQRLLRDGISSQASKATVVVTNPQHLAVALRYALGEPAPVVVARGQGRLAERIKALARRFGIPIRQEPALARALYAACPLGAQIPPALYQAVALILAELYREAAQRRQALYGHGPLYS